MSQAPPPVCQQWQRLAHASSPWRVLPVPPLWLTISGPLLSELCSLILWHLAQTAPLSLCVLIFISEAVALIPNPDGPMERSPVLRGYSGDISHVLGTRPGSPLHAWQMPAVTLNLSHSQAEDISPHVKHAKSQDTVFGLETGPRL